MAKKPKKTNQELENLKDRVVWLLKNFWQDNRSAMAADVGVGHSVLSKIARTERTPGPRLLAAIAQHPKVNPAWLYTGKGEPLLAENTIKGQFDEVATDTASAFILQLCRTVPELRSVAVVFDWQGELAQVAPGFLWGNQEGPITPNNVEAVHGCLAQTTKLLSHQTRAGISATIALQQAIQQAKVAELAQTTRTGPTRGETPAQEEAQADNRGRDPGDNRHYEDLSPRRDGSEAGPPGASPKG